MKWFNELCDRLQESRDDPELEKLLLQAVVAIEALLKDKEALESHIKELGERDE